MSIISGLTSLSLLNGLINQANNNLPPDYAQLVGWWKASDLAAAQNSAAVSSPLQIGSCAAWYRADMGITNVGGTVTAWADQSGSGDVNKILVGTGHAPTFNSSDATYNNQPTISFASASSQYLVSGNWAASLNQPYTVVIVGNDSGAAANQVYAASFTAIYFFQNNGSAQYLINANAALISSVVPSSSPHIVQSICNTTTSAIYINGNTSTASGTIGTNAALTRLDVGATNGSDPLNGKIAEVIVFSVALNATQINQVNCYLSNRYAIPLKQSAWSNKIVADSNTNLAQATYAHQPTLVMSSSSYNSQPSLGLLGSSPQYMKSGTWATKLNQPMTVVIVGNDDAGASEEIYMSDNANSVYPLITNTTAGKYAIDGGGVLTSNANISSMPTVYVMVINNASSAIYISHRTADATGSTSTGNSFTGLTIGCEGAGGFPLNGSVAEVLIYNAALSSAQINAVLAELGATYGVSIGS